MTDDKQLKSKAVDIKGKKYVLVSDRVLYFNEKYQNGAIVTEKVDTSDRVEIKAIVYPDVDKPLRMFTGHSQAVWGDGYINKTSALENAETSAVGRALAMMGIGVIESIASADEINKAKNQSTVRPYLSGKQLELILNKGKWALNSRDKDEVLNWLCEVVGKMPNELFADEVDGSLQKIDAASRLVKVEAKTHTPNPDEKVHEVGLDTVAEVPDGPINLDDIPY